MKLNSKDLDKILDNNVEDFDAALDKSEIMQRLNKIQAKEKHDDRKIYGTPDKKRFKR